MLVSMIRFMARAILLSMAGIVDGQNSIGRGDLRSQVQRDAEHGTELSPRSSVGSSTVLSVRDREALLKAIEVKLRSGNADLDNSSQKELENSARAARVRLVDLNGDRVPEVIVQSMRAETCGAVGNCEFWVFKKTPAGYVSILDAGSQRFSVEESRSNGYLDLTLALHDSATQQQLNIYRFQRGRYRQMGCYEADWRPEINGPVLKHPTTTKCK